MKKIFFAGLVLALSAVAFSACKNDHAKKAATEPAPPGTKYICPMNCEKGKTYDQPGSCPVCHMDLEPIKAEVEANKAEYFTNYSSNPAQLAAGKAGLMTFIPKIKGNESVQVPLDLVHEKKMHLILVSDDLSWFDHIHPEYTGNGGYEIKVLGKGDNFTNGRGHNETRFETGGQYWAFTDYKPVGGLNQVNKTPFAVEGNVAKPVAYKQPKLSSVVDGYTVAFGEGHDNKGFVAGSMQHIPVTVSKAGKVIEPATFENYLGEKSHVIMVEVDSKEFVHTHPAASKGQLDIHTTFPKAGMYRVWLQFQTEGKVHTADFVLQVGEGTAGKEQNDGHTNH